MYQYAFDRSEFSALNAIFRRIKTDEFNRNINIGESIFVSDTSDLQGNSSFPIRYFDCIENHEKEIMALKRACDLKMISVRGVDIEEQVQAKSA